MHPGGCYAADVSRTAQFRAVLHSAGAITFTEQMTAQKQAAARSSDNSCSCRNK